MTLVRDIVTGTALVVLGIAMIVAGLAFKVAAVPSTETSSARWIDLERQ